jgi:hypothetical protein
MRHSGYRRASRGGARTAVGRQRAQIVQNSTFVVELQAMGGSSVPKIQRSSVLVGLSWVENAQIRSLNQLPLTVHLVLVQNLSQKRLKSVC